jgi:hypothetical protein
VVVRRWVNNGNNIAAIKKNNREKRMKSERGAWFKTAKGSTNVSQAVKMGTLKQKRDPPKSD